MSQQSKQFSIPVINSLEEAIKHYETHIESDHLVVGCDDAICTIRLNSTEKKYEVLVKPYDIKANVKVEDFLKGEQG